MADQQKDGNSKWTIMVYIAADATLADFAIQSLKPLRAVCSESVAIAAQFDADRKQDIPCWFFDDSDVTGSLIRRDPKSELTSSAETETSLPSGQRDDEEDTNSFKLIEVARQADELVIQVYSGSSAEMAATRIEARNPLLALNSAGDGRSKTHGLGDVSPEGTKATIRVSKEGIRVSQGPEAPEELPHKDTAPEISRFCSRCGSQTQQVTGRYQYQECGMDNVFFEGWTILVCARCKTRLPLLPDPTDCARFIAEELVRQPSRLNGDAILFLRKLLGLKGVDLAEKLNVDRVTVSRWENDNTQIEGLFDFRLRLTAVDEIPWTAKRKAELKREIGDVFQYAYVAKTSVGDHEIVIPHGKNLAAYIDALT